MFDYILSLGGTVFVPIIMIGTGDRHGDRQPQSPYQSDD